MVNDDNINDESAIDGNFNGIELVLTYVGMLRRRIKLLVSAFVLISAIGIILTLRQAPIYKATATLIIEPDLGYVPDQQSSASTDHFKESFNTQLKLITSRTVLESALQTLKQLYYPGAVVDNSSISRLRSRITVERENNTMLVKLTIRHSDPQMASREVNALTKVFIKHQLDDQISSTKDAFDWLSQQSAILKAQVKKSEMDLLKYKEDENIVSLEKKQILLEERIDKVNQSHISISARNRELATVLREIDSLDKNSSLESLPQILENPLVNHLKNERDVLVLKLVEKSKKYKHKHPEVIGLKAQVTKLEDQLALEIEKIVESIQVEERINWANKEEVENTLQDLKVESMQLAKQAIEYGVLKREAESNQSLFNVLLQQLRTTDLEGNVGSNSIRVVDAAIMPTHPINELFKRGIVVSLILALGLSIVLCLAIEMTDQSIKNEKDIEQNMNETVLGQIPFEQNLLSGDEPSQQLDRSYRDIKTGLRFFQQEYKLKTILLTSTCEKEGKSTSTHYIGKAFAQSGNKVLIVDADLINPGLTRMLNQSRSYGISDYVLKNLELSDAIHQIDSSNLWVLPAGTLLLKSAEIIGSNLMKEMLDKARESFDIILIDSPPLLATMEVAALGKQVDGVVAITKAHGPSRNLVKKTLKTIRAMKGNVIGIVLTGVKHESTFSYYGYGEST